MTLENKYLLEQNLNTSYVTVKQINKINKMPNVSNLNTSYVTVKL